MAKGGKGGGGGGKPGGGGGGDDGPLSINGNKKANTLIGGSQGDNIWGRDGDDTLYGRGGNDLLVGGDDNDTLFGEADDDRLHGGEGDDTLDGGVGNDELQGGEGSDFMDGGDDNLADGVDHDVASFVEVGWTTSTLLPDMTYKYDGLEFTAFADGENGWGYTATDPLNPDPADTTNGYDVDTVVRVEELRGTNYDDIMNGGAGDDYFVGARGADTISGNSGDDTLYGSLDDDEIDAGEDGGSGSDTLVFLRYNTDGDPGDDTWALGDGNDIVTGFDVGTDTILFIGNEDFEPTPAMITEFGQGGVTGTLITYASDSSILLKGIDFDNQAGSIMFDWEYVDV